MHHSDAKIIAIAMIAAVFVGAGSFWYFFRPTVVIEKPAEEIKQPDGSIVVEKAPDAMAKPKHMTPKGTKVERTVSVKVQGDGLKMPSGEVKPCPPVTVDLSLIREKDGQNRVIASSPDGEILKAIDVPVETAAPPPEPKLNAVGVRVDPVHKAIDGVWYERDFERIRGRVEAIQPVFDNGRRDKPSVHVGIGWTF